MMTSSEITNIALFGIFQSCKKTRFAKEPDYNEVLNQISSALDVPQSEKLMTDIKAFFPRYVEYVKNSRSLSSCSRNLDEKVVLYRHNYVPKLRRPLEEIGDRHNFTESGLEANNKFLRQYRINKARKTNQFDNLTDCINRLWDKSDPNAMKAMERLTCKHCKGLGQHITDATVNTRLCYLSLQMNDLKYITSLTI